MPRGPRLRLRPGSARRRRRETLRRGSFAAFPVSPPSVSPPLSRSDLKRALPAIVCPSLALFIARQRGTERTGEVKSFGRAEVTALVFHGLCVKEKKARAPRTGQGLAPHLENTDRNTLPKPAQGLPLYVGRR